ncbi:hypothetical protein ACQ4PT_024907 [Festuca glaucescens]
MAAPTTSRKLYGYALSSNSVRIAALLNEKGLDYELVAVDLDNKTPEFLAISVKSRAISRHIATKYKHLGPDLLPTPSAKLETWLEVHSHNFYPAVADLVYELRVRPRLPGGASPDPAVVDGLARKVADVLDVYEARLAAGNRYLAGDAFTLADVNHMTQLNPKPAMASNAAQKACTSSYIIHVQSQEKRLLGTSDDTKAFHLSFLPEHSRLLHSYHHVASGFAARLTRRELDAIASMPGFVAAVPDVVYRVLTTHSDVPRAGHGAGWEESLCRVRFQRLYVQRPQAHRSALGVSSAAATALLPVAPTDEDGHGTHTSSNEDGCAGVDILAGIDAAVSDGCDVISISLGGPSHPYYKDSIAIGTFAAAEKGIFVSMAAGNSGPFHGTLSNDAPWMLTVAASTMDRLISAKVILGNGLSFDGESLYQLHAVAAELREVCGARASVDKREGSRGSVWLQFVDGYSTFADAHVLPASQVSYAAGVAIRTYIKSTAKPTAQISFRGTVLGISPAPAIASSSSRGPSIQNPGILKPDITGPGVSVVAAWPFQVAPPRFDLTPAFNIISGTSMSTPHLSGIAALVKRNHPDWSPAAIKSAIMTTADVTDRSGTPIVDEQRTAADLFAVGSGHVNPEKAVDPGLVFDISPEDYIGYLCGMYTNKEVSVIARRPVDCSAVTVISDIQLNYPSVCIFPAGVELDASGVGAAHGEERRTYRCQRYTTPMWTCWPTAA